MTRLVARAALNVVTLLASFAVTSPAYGAAAKSPDELIRNLNAAAGRGDVDAFVAELTADARKAVKDAEARQSTVRQLRQDFRAALDERFGKGGEMLEEPIDTLAAAIARVAGTELIGQSERADGTVELRVRLPEEPAPRAKTRSRQGKARETKPPPPHEETLLARREGDGWKLSLKLPPSGGDPAPQVNAAKRITQRVRAGELKDRIAAMVEWSNAWSVKEAGK